MELAIDTRHAIAIHVPKTEGEYRRSPDKAIWRTTRELKMDTYNALSTSGAMYTSKMCPKAAEHGARCDGSSKGAGRRNAGASAHAGARDRAGTAGVGDHQGHRMPKPQPHDATWPPTLSVAPSHSDGSLPRLTSSARCDGSSKGAGGMLGRARTQGHATALVRRAWGTIRGIVCQSHSLMKPRGHPH